MRSRRGRVAAMLRITTCMATAAALTSGCAHAPGYVLSGAIPREQPVERVLWLDPIQIDEPAIGAGEPFAVAFAYNTARYLRQRKLFQKVRILPGVVGPEDWIGRIRIERLGERRRFEPLSYLTLGIYYLISGRGERLEADMIASLEIRTSTGEVVGSARETRKRELPVSSRNQAELAAFFLDERRRLVDQLFDRALDLGDELLDGPEPAVEEKDDLFGDDEELDPPTRDDDIFEPDPKNPDEDDEP